MNRRTAACLALGLLLLPALLPLSGCGRRPRPAPAAAPAAAREAVLVRTEPAAVRDFRRLLRLQGSIDAKGAARIAARVPGTLDEIRVDQGDRVAAGDVLFVTDRLNLENRVEAERQNVLVTAAGMAEARAGLRQAEVGCAKATLDYERFKRLYEEQKAVTQDAFEKVETAWRQALAGVDYRQALVTVAEARRQQAEATLRIAEKTLADSRVVAPFAGVVTARLLEPGEYANAGAAVLTLEPPATLEAVFLVPSEYYATIEPGTTVAQVWAGGRDLGELPVTQRAPAVDPLSRTFEVKVRLPADCGVASGVLCDGALVLERRRALGVRSAALTPRGGQSCLFVARDGHAVLVPVHAGIVEAGYTELLDSDLAESAAVVVEGQAFLEDGAPLREE